MGVVRGSGLGGGVCDWQYLLEDPASYFTRAFGGEVVVGVGHGELGERGVVFCKLGFSFGEDVVFAFVAAQEEEVGVVLGGRGTAMALNDDAVDLICLNATPVR